MAIAYQLGQNSRILLEYGVPGNLISGCSLLMSGIPYFTLGGAANASVTPITNLASGVAWLDSRPQVFTGDVYFQNAVSGVSATFPGQFATYGQVLSMNQSGLNAASNYSGLQTQTNILQSGLNIATANIATNTSGISSNTSSISGLSNSISGLQVALSTINSSLGISISGLQTELNSTDSVVSGISTLSIVNQNNVTTLTNSTIPGIQSQVSGLQVKTNILSNNQSGISNTLGSVQTSIVLLINSGIDFQSRSSISGLTGMFVTEQLQVNSISTQVSGLTSAVNGITSGISFGTLASNQSGLQNEIVNTQTRTTALEGSVSVLQVSTVGLATQQTVLANSISGLNNNVNILSNDITGYASAISGVDLRIPVTATSNTVSGLTTTVYNLSGATLSNTKSIQTLTASQNTLISNYSGLQTQTTSQGNTITQNSSNILVLNSDVDLLNIEVSNLISGVSSLTALSIEEGRQLSGLSTTLTNTQNRVTVLTSNYSGLQSQVQSSPWKIITSTYTASLGDKIQADTSLGSFTISLPSPIITSGVSLNIEDATFSWGFSGLTISGNGSLISGTSSTYKANVIGGKLSVTYIRPSFGWSIK